MSQDNKHLSVAAMKRSALLFSYAGLAAFFLALFAGIFYSGLLPTNQPRRATKNDAWITSKELEQMYGIRVTLIGVTAGGGMVDFRYKVVDAEKASELISHHARMPQLIPGGSQTRLGIPGAHSPSIKSGKVYYMLFGNANGIVQPGTPVSVAFGDVILEPIKAQ